MLARICPVSLSPYSTPGTWYGIDVDERAHGICWQPLQAAAWSFDSGASLAPKSTVGFVIAATPAPLPTEPYVICAFLYSACHWEISGYTNVLPAPFRLPPFELA